MDASLSDLKHAQRCLTDRLAAVKGKRLDIGRDEVAAAEQAARSSCAAEHAQVESSLKDEVNQLLTRCERAERLLAHTDKVEEDSLETERRYRLLAAENRDLLTEVERKDASLRELEAKLDHTTKVAREGEAAGNRLRSRVAALESSLNNVETDQNELRRGNAETKLSLAQAEDELALLRDARARAEEDKAAAVAAAQPLQARLAGLEEANAVLTTAVEGFERDAEAAALRSLQRDEESAAAVAQLKSEKAALQEEAATRRQDEARLRELLQAETQARQQAQAEHDALRESGHKGAADHAAEVQQLREQLRVADDVSRKLDASVASLKEQHAAAHRDAERAVAETAAADERHRQCSAALRAAQASETDALSKMRTTQAVHEDLESSVRALHEDNARLRGELQAAMSEIQSLLADVSREHRIAEGLRAATQQAEDLQGDKRRAEAELAQAVLAQTRAGEAHAAEVARLRHDAAQLEERCAARTAEAAEQRALVGSLTQQLHQEEAVVEKLSFRIEESGSWEKKHALLAKKHSQLAEDYELLSKKREQDVNVDAAVSELRCTRDLLSAEILEGVAKTAQILKSVEGGLQAYSDGIAVQNKTITALGSISTDIDTARALNAPQQGKLADVLDAAKRRLSSVLATRVSESERQFLGIPRRELTGDDAAPPSEPVLSSSALRALKQKLVALAKASNELEAAVKARQPQAQKAKEDAAGGDKAAEESGAAPTRARAASTVRRGKAATEATKVVRKKAAEKGGGGGSSASRGGSAEGASKAAPAHLRRV